ncbi:amidohydrolase family protein [Virgibacillus oceani]
MIKAFYNANIIIGENKDVINNGKGYIIFNNDNGKIIEVGENFEEKASNLVYDETFNLKGNWVLPGLINGHVHIMRNGSAHPDALIKNESMEMITLHALKNAKEHLNIGVTSIRDLGSTGFTTLAVRDAVKTGLFEAPNISSCGTPLIMTGGHFRTGKEVDGEVEVRKGTRQLLKDGVDVVKLFATGGIYSEGEEPGSPQLTKEEIQVAVEEAHKKNIPVACHAQGLTGIYNCLHAGVDTVEHAIYADEKALELFVTQGTFLVPTMVAMVRIAEGKELGIPEYAVEKAKIVVETHFSMLEKAVEYGVKIATGTDAGSPCNPPEDIFKEFEIMKQAGMSELDVIEASTSVAADAINLKNRGVLKTGAYADMLVVKSNPLDDVENLKEQNMVIKNGEIIKNN